MSVASVASVASLQNNECSVAKLNIIIDSHLHDGGVFIERRLDLAAANVLAAADDDIFLSVHDVPERGEKEVREGGERRG